MVVVWLWCGHALRIREEPYPRDEWCPTCERSEFIRDWWKEAWHVVCPCGVNSRHGNSRKYADQRAAQHNSPRCAPRVQWFDDAPQQVRERLPKISHEILTFPVDPPF